jgi:hypothetical protein
MTVPPVPLAEITVTGIRVLCREMGAVNAARFLNQFTTGLGDYTEERDQLIGEPTVDELLAQIKRRKKIGRSQKPAPRTTRLKRR